MKIKTLASPRATWREHFLAVAREAQASGPQPAGRARAGLKPRIRALALVPRPRVMAAATAA